MSATVTMPTPAQLWPFTRKRWTIAEFDRLVTLGILREGDRTFLRDGEIFEPMPENMPPVNANMILFELFLARLPSADWTINLGKPVILGEGYKPQPDVTVLRGPRSAYRSRTPTAADVALLVEVADSTYPDNVGAFLRAYAEAGIAQYWSVNISQRRIEVYTDPGRAEDGTPIYRGRRDFGLEESVPLEGIGGEGFVPEPVSVRDVLRDSLEPADGGR